MDNSVSSPPYESHTVSDNFNMAEYAGEVEVDIQDVEKLFDAAAEYVRTVRSLSDENKLCFYALYKQVGTLYSFSSTVPFIHVINFLLKRDLL